MLRKAQAAIEFLMTYGWAILVVLVVIGALAYFGILNPSMLLPEKCTFPVQFGCADFEVGRNGLQLVLQNSGGKDIKVLSLTFSSDALNSLSGTCGTGTMNAVVKNGEKATFYANEPLNCNFKDTGRSKNKYSAEVTYSFLGSTLPHITSGELFANKGDGTISGGTGKYGGGSGDSSLIGYWNFEDGSGISASDSSGQGNTGTLSGFGCTTLDCNPSSGWVSNGRRGKALAFDGVNDYVGTGNTVPANGPATIEGWYYFSQSAQERGNTVSLNSQLYQHNANNFIYMKGIGNNDYFYIAPSTNAWHHMAYTYSGDTSTGILYVDGAENGASVQSGPETIPAISGLSIGGGSGALPFKGLIDEVHIYNRALSPQEVAVLFSQ